MSATLKFQILLKFGYSRSFVKYKAGRSCSYTEVWSRNLWKDAGRGLRQGQTHQGGNQHIRLRASQSGDIVVAGTSLALCAARSILGPR
jgi:hypothetical protein